MSASTPARLPKWHGAARAVTVFAAAGLVGCSSGAGGTGDQERESESRPDREVVAIVGGERSDRAALRKVIATAGASGLRQVAFRDEAIVFLVEADDGRAAARGTWEALVIAGAYIDSSPLRDEGIAVAWRYTGLEPGEFATGSFPGRRRSRLAPQPIVSAETLRRRVRRAAVAQGLRITHLQMAEPLGSTVVMTLRGGSVADLVARQGEITLEITESVADPDRPRSDGVYFEVWSDDSQFIFGSGYATRMSSGVAWRNPRHD